MKKATKLLDDGSTTGLKVEEYRQEDDTSWLAIQLAESFQAMTNHQNDYNALTASALSERTKAVQLQHVIFQLKEREKNGPPSYPIADVRRFTFEPSTFMV